MAQNDIQYSNHCYLRPSSRLSHAASKTLDLENSHRIKWWSNLENIEKFSQLFARFSTFSTSLALQRTSLDGEHRQREIRWRCCACNGAVRAWLNRSVRLPYKHSAKSVLLFLSLCICYCATSIAKSQQQAASYTLLYALCAGKRQRFLSGTYL